LDPARGLRSTYVHHRPTSASGTPDQPTMSAGSAAAITRDSYEEVAQGLAAKEPCSFERSVPVSARRLCRNSCWRALIAGAPVVACIAMLGLVICWRGTSHRPRWPDLHHLNLWTTLGTSLDDLTNTSSVNRSGSWTTRRTGPDTASITSSAKGSRRNKQRTGRGRSSRRNQQRTGRGARSTKKVSWTVTDPGLADMSDLANLAKRDRSYGNKIALNVGFKTRCFGFLMDAAFQLADLGVTMYQASRDCLAVAEPSLQPLVTAQETVTALKALLQNMRDQWEDENGDDDIATAKSDLKLRRLWSGGWRVKHDSSERGSTGQLEQLEKNFTANHFPEQFEQAVNNIASVQTDLELVSTTNINDLYSPRREAQIHCARDIGVGIRSSNEAISKLNLALPVCVPNAVGLRAAKDKEFSRFRKSTKCASRIAKSIRYCGTFTTDLSRFVDECRAGYSLAKCASRLESFSWEVSAATRRLFLAIHDCERGPKGRFADQIPMHKHALGVTLCAVPLMSAMGIIAAAGMNIATGHIYACKQYEAPIQGTPDLETQIEAARRKATCAKYALSAVRELFLAIWRALTSVSACTSESMRCMEQISQSASAFFGVAQAMSNFADACYAYPPELELSEEAKLRQAATCARHAGGMVKMLGVAGGFASQASNSCIGKKLAGNACTAAVWRAIAGLGSMAELYAKMQINCRLTERWFKCGANIRLSGSAHRNFVLGVTAAALNCPLPAAGRPWKNTRQFNFPRSFTVP